MNDAAIWFALILVAVTGWGYALALAMELRRVRAENASADVQAVKDGWEIEDLRAQLAQASKNDSRDAKGRYVSAEAICTEPQGYVGKAHSDALRRQASL